MNGKFFCTEQQDLILDLCNVKAIFHLSVLFYSFCKYILPSKNYLDVRMNAER